MAFTRPSFLTKPATAGVIYSTVFGSLMWFWIMYRAKEDGPYMIVSSAKDVSISFNFID